MSGISIPPVVGTAAAYNIGTSGATVPLCNGANTWAQKQIINADVDLDVGGGGSVSITLKNSSGSAPKVMGVSSITYVRSGNVAGNLFIVDDGATSRLVVDPSGINPFSSTTASAANVNQAGSGVGNPLLRSTSARRYKRDIMPIGLAEAMKLLQAQPVRYHSRSAADDPNQIFFGFIAEQIEEIGLKPLVHYAYQEDQIENVLVNEVEREDGEPERFYEQRPKKGEAKRPDGLQYERIVCLQQLLINELFTRLDAVEKRRR